MSLEIINREAKSLGLQINWLKSKTKIQTTDTSLLRVPLCPWPGTMLKSSSHLHILVLTSIALGPVSMISWNVLQSRNCMATASTDRNIWLSSMSLPTKLRLHLVFIIHVILYRAETWPPARQLQRNIDAFHRSVCGVYYAFSGGPAFL